jgi:uncharacterized protein YdaT
MTMPWTLERYPPAMQRLPLAIRAKAIEIANAMLAEGYDEGQAIRMAIAAAKKWAWGADDRAPGRHAVGEASSSRGAGAADAHDRGR